MKILYEGLSWKEYLPQHLALAAPAAVGLFVLTELLRFSCSELPFDAAGIPNNALIYAFHTDTMSSFLADQFRRKTAAVWIGYHGAASYAGSLGLALRHEPCFRYRRDPHAPRPLQQILDFLRTHPGRVYLRTDAGGPYGRVKASLYDLCIGSGRPLVAVRHRASRSIRIAAHHFPLPFASVQSVCSAPLTAQFLQTLPDKNAALDWIQASIDQLAKP